MDGVRKLEIPRFIIAGLMAKSPALFAGSRWYVAERAGDRFAVNFILKPQQRRGLLVCLIRGIRAITAQEVAELFGQHDVKSAMKHFYETLLSLTKWKIARVYGEELGEPIRIFSKKSFRKPYGRAEWTFTPDYLDWLEQARKQKQIQWINYPVIGLAVNLNKKPMAPMLMLAFSEWFSMNKRKSNARKIPVMSALNYFPIGLDSGYIGREAKYSIDNALKGFGLKPITGPRWREAYIDLMPLFPATAPRRKNKKKTLRKTTQRDRKQVKSVDIQGGQFPEKGGQFPEKGGQFPEKGGQFRFLTQVKRL